MSDTYICDGWCCVDCLILLANGETDQNLSEDETAEYLAAFEAGTAGYDVTLGLLREQHGCRSNATVSYMMRADVPGTLRRGAVEVLADNVTDANDMAYWRWEVPAGAWLTGRVVWHELETENDRGGECDCEEQSFSWSPCDVCNSNLGGSRHAVSFWKREDQPAAV